MFPFRSAPREFAGAGFGFPQADAETAAIAQIDDFMPQPLGFGLALAEIDIALEAVDQILAAEEHFGDAIQLQPPAPPRARAQAAEPQAGGVQNLVQALVLAA